MGRVLEVLSVGSGVGWLGRALEVLGRVLGGWFGCVGWGVGRVVRGPPFLLFRKRIQFFVLLFYLVSVKMLKS